MGRVGLAMFCLVEELVPMVWLMEEMELVPMVWLMEEMELVPMVWLAEEMPMVWLMEEMPMVWLWLMVLPLERIWLKVLMENYHLN